MVASPPVTSAAEQPIGTIARLKGRYGLYLKYGTNRWAAIAHDHNDIMIDSSEPTFEPPDRVYPPIDRPPKG
jgi:hypothetical protein